MSKSPFVNDVKPAAKEPPPNMQAGRSNEAAAK